MLDYVIQLIFVYNYSFCYHHLLYINHRSQDISILYIISIMMWYQFILYSCIVVLVLNKAQLVQYVSVNI